MKLSLPLLTRDEETHYISVNFDPALVRLLRETKYFLLAELQVPESALAIYAQVETFRVWTQKLDMVVMKHNGADSASFPGVSELQLGEAGVCATQRTRDAVDASRRWRGGELSHLMRTQVPSRNCYPWKNR